MSRAILLGGRIGRTADFAKSELCSVCYGPATYGHTDWYHAETVGRPAGSYCGDPSCYHRAKGTCSTGTNLWAGASDG